MRAVANETHTTTSAVSQQIAALAREAGTALIEPEGRRVRLTPAGLRLAGHAVTILAAVEAARLDLDPSAEPAGTLRVAGFGTAIRRSLMPVLSRLASDHPKVRVRIHEHEPAEALALIAADDLDLALTYDFNLAPATPDRSLVSRPLWSTEWALGVPAADLLPHGFAAGLFSEPPTTGLTSPVATGLVSPAATSRLAPDTVTTGPIFRAATTGLVSEAATIGGHPDGRATALEPACPSPDVLARYRDHDWIVNSRGAADEQAVRTIASMAGFEPLITHRADSLALLQDLVTAGLGIGLLPADQPTSPGVRLLPLRDPCPILRTFAVVRAGRTEWPPLALLLNLLDTTAS